MSINTPGTTLRGPLNIKAAPGSTNTADIPVITSLGKVLEASITPNGVAPVGTSFLKVAHAIFDFSVDGGVTGLITPVSTAAIPANAILVGGSVNVVAAVTSLGSATLAVGTSAGSSASALLAATAKASLTLAAMLNAVPVFATPVKMSAAGNITVTVGTADLTAGKVEIFIVYYVASNA